MSATEGILLAVAREHSERFAATTNKSPWEYFEYSVKLALARWTALRMAIEGGWGGGDMRRKYEILLDEIFHVFKYNKTVYAHAMAENITNYLESEFSLICEDGSVEEVAEMLTVLADECKKAQYGRVDALRQQVQSLVPIDLKAAKVKAQDDGVGLAEVNVPALETICEKVGLQEASVDEEGFKTVRRSGRRKVPRRIYDPAAEFPGAA